MIVTKTILCDLTGYKLNVVEVSQNDNLSRAVACRLRANGEPWEPPEGVTAAVSYTLPDGTPGMYDAMPDGTPAAVIEGSTVTVRLLDRMMAAPGAVDASVILADSSGARLATFPFRLRVIGNNPLFQAETYPALGQSFAGMLICGGPGGQFQPLAIGPGLRTEDGVLTAIGGGGGLSVEDDGQGNVSILSGGTSSVQDDGAGNITFS